MSSSLAHSSFDPVASAAELVLNWAGIVVPGYRLPAIEAELVRIGAGESTALGLQRLLADDQAAREALLRAVTIPESYLFRHAGHYALLRDAALARKRADRPCHVLSAGAATGEEAWSAAAVLADIYGAESTAWSVTGWELDGSRVRRAHRGRYSKWSARQGLHGYERFFANGDGDVVVGQSLRDRVSFERCNLIDETYPGTEPFDVIFFRNVSIYWAPSFVEQTVTRLIGRLESNGILMVGPSDPIPLDRERWQFSIVDGVRGYSRAAARPRDQIAHAVTRSSTANATTSGNGAPRPLAARGKSRSHPPFPLHASSKVDVGLRPQAPATPASPAPPVSSSTSTPPSTDLETVRRLADAGKYRDGLELLRQMPEPRPPEAKLLQGILLLTTEEAQEATRVLRQCVFLEPEEPSFRRWLAVALETTGKNAEAAREHRNAVELETQ